MSISKEQALKILYGRYNYYENEGYIGTISFREALKIAIKAINENEELHKELEQANEEISRLRAEADKVNTDVHTEEQLWDGSGD